MRNNILAKLNDLGRYDRDLVETAIIQVEALFIFALMKSTLSSQR